MQIFNTHFKLNLRLSITRFLTNAETNVFSQSKYKKVPKICDTKKWYLKSDKNLYIYSLCLTIYSYQGVTACNRSRKKIEHVQENEE